MKTNARATERNGCQRSDWNSRANHLWYVMLFCLKLLLQLTYTFLEYFSSRFVYIHIYIAVLVVRCNQSSCYFTTTQPTVWGSNKCKIKSRAHICTRDRLANCYRATEASKQSPIFKSV